MKLEFCRQSFEKHSNIKFRENPSSGSRVVQCGRTDRRTDMTKLIVGFRNFANAPPLHQICEPSVISDLVRYGNVSDSLIWRINKSHKTFSLARLMRIFQRLLQFIGWWNVCRVTESHKFIRGSSLTRRLKAEYSQIYSPLFNIF